MPNFIPPVAMILAAGRGRRMQPLSDVIPKPALPVPGGLVVGWGLRLVSQCGAPNVVLNSWWLAETMEQAATSALPAGLDLRFSREETLMETAGALALARDRGLLGTDGPVLVINGDGILNLNLNDVFRRHQETDDLVTLALLPHLGPDLWSRVLLDQDGLVSTILPPGKPAADETPFLYPGVMVVSREALDTLETTPSGTKPALWIPARSLRRLGGVVLSGHWREVGTPPGYLEAVVSMLGDRNDIHPSADISQSAVLSRTLIGPDVTVETGAVISQSILSHGAVVGADARIIRSIVLGKARIADGERLTDDIRVTGR